MITVIALSLLAIIENIVPDKQPSSRLAPLNSAGLAVRDRLRAHVQVLAGEIGAEIPNTMNLCSSEEDPAYPAPLAVLLCELQSKFKGHRDSAALVICAG